MTPQANYAHSWIESALGIIKAPRPEVTAEKQGWGTLKHNRSIQGTPLCLNGQEFERGLGTHAESEITVSLPFAARSFLAVVGVDDNVATRVATKPCELEFSLEIEGRTLWISPVLTQKDTPLEVEVPLGGARQFVLKVRDVNDRIAFAHADWAEARVVLENGETALLSHEGRLLPKRPPISFVYGGRSSTDLLDGWAQSTSSSPQEDGTVIHSTVYTDAGTGLQCQIEMTQFPDFAAAEWVMRFKNTGLVNTPILEEVKALDFHWEAVGVDIKLHRSRGSHGQVEDFQYQTDYLHRRETFPESNNIVMTPGGGRSSQDWLPFFNLQTGKDGFLSAIGWSGEWKAEFLCSDGADVHTKMGMEQTHLTLHPGEEIRTPRIMLLFWEGDIQEAHNQLRRFLLKYHTPQAGGQPAQVPICSASWGGVKTAEHLRNIESFTAKGLEYDCYWVDAGWYGLGATDCPDVFVGDWGSQAGNWNINSYRHPNGLRPISEAARGKGLKFLLWFELQRAIVGTKLPTEHPDWFFARQETGDSLLLDIGNPDALQWCIETVSGYISEQGLDWYRQDFNIDPLSFWRAADEPDRQGIAEIRNIEGLYAFWDELRKRHPNLMIDNCASGGRCLDLETIGRSISLWRTDYPCFTGISPTGAQVQLTGLLPWLPLHAGGTQLDSVGDTYAFRSAVSAGLSDQLAMYEAYMPKNDEDWAWVARMLAEQKRLRPFFYGDFYALTACSASPEAWCVYQLHRPEESAGFVMAFRREESPFSQGTFVLKGLEPEAAYSLEDADTGAGSISSGNELMSAGLTLEIEDQRSSKLFYLRKLLTSK